VAASVLAASCLLSPQRLVAQDRAPGPAVVAATSPPLDSSTARAALIDYEAALARARAEYEEAVRSIAARQAQLERRVLELESALQAIRGAGAVARPEASSGGQTSAEPLLEELAKARGDYEETLARARAEYEAATRSAARLQDQLEQRIRELQAAQTAQEDATRQIIRDATSSLGSQINQFVAFGGTFEVATGWLKSPRSRPETFLEIATAETDFEIQANDWTLGSLILEYVGNAIDVDTAFLTVGDPQRLPPFATVGRIILPFGISTGDPVADVLTLEDPLTIEAFEFREMGVLIGAGFPTRRLAPAAPPVAPPRVEPRTLNPFFRAISRGFGYNAPPAPPPTPVTPPPAPPLFNVGVVLYQGATSAATNGRFNWGATAGLVKKWDCGRSYDEGWSPFSCPISLDVDVDYISSIFDSRMLGAEYRPHLNQIRFVRGMASSVKAAVGALSFVGEWNGALDRARFVDGSGTLVTMKPSAWQVSLAYQFDWNPWVEAIGAQGTYLAVSHSRSEDLAGFSQGGRRTGFVPRRRYSLSAGEWIMEGFRLAIDYSREEDYPRNQGGTGDASEGIRLMLTYAW
jgi:hypothetical protein